ncbi:MAG: hypothetical protein IAG13_10720 [Deltaproteobacteria bacterium]|nr:hypothetical protein [Nannocystaceae bacterium]
MQLRIGLVLASVAFASIAAGCHPALVPLLAQAASQKNKTQVAAVPTGDGAQYVSVITEASSLPTAVRNRWRRECLHACDGDYLVLSENAAVRTAGGRNASRMHEGFIRCVSPEATLRDEDKPVSDQGRSDSSRVPAKR